jgi:hypothetical protein
MYDYSARHKDDWRFTTVDPMAEKYYSISPYAYCGNNPLKYIDPTGMAVNPIYDEYGSLLGTDELGLQGNALIMNKDDFKQGMFHDEALKKDLGKDGLKNEEAKLNLAKSYQTLSSRPDYDGYLTLSEANEWYRTGKGEPLYVDAAKIDLSPLTSGQLEPAGLIHYINFASPAYANFETGLIYGTLGVTHLGSGTAKIGNANNLIDNYGFEMQEGRTFRNFATKIGEAVAGKGTSYNIYGYGYGKVKYP